MNEKIPCHLLQSNGPKQRIVIYPKLELAKQAAALYGGLAVELELEQLKQRGVRYYVFTDNSDAFNWTNLTAWLEGHFAANERAHERQEPQQK